MAIASNSQPHEMTKVETSNMGSSGNSNSTSKPMIHPALVSALNKHNQENLSDLDSHSPSTSLNEDTVMTTNQDAASAGGGNTVSNLILTSPFVGEENAMEKQGGSIELESKVSELEPPEVSAFVEQEPDKNDWTPDDVIDKNVQTNEVGLPMIKSVPQPDGLNNKAESVGEEYDVKSAASDEDMKDMMDKEADNGDSDLISESFESIPPPNEVSIAAEPSNEEDDPILPDEAFDDYTNTLAEANEEGDLPAILREEDATGSINEAAFVDEQGGSILNNAQEEELTSEEQSMEEVESKNMIMFYDEEESEPSDMNLEQSSEAMNEEVGDGKVFDQSYQDESEVIGAPNENTELESKIILSEETAEAPETTSEELPETEYDSQESVQNNLDKTDEGERESNIKDNNDDGPGNFQGFDEDFSSGHIDVSNLDQPPDTAESNVSVNSNSPDDNNYTGDGFTYHILQPKSRGHESSTIPVAAIVALLAFLVCFCCIRYKRRRSRYLKTSRGKYSAIGSDDFFNGTFSDDISFNGKDSDDEMSYGSDDGNCDGVKIELGNIHEMEVNGGLTLEEING
jgi:hypothetical protein